MTPGFVHRSRIRFVDTDASGRIHYTALFRQFEAAEEELFRWLGRPYTELENQDDSYPRVHVEADYTAALCSGDEIEIAVAVEKVGARSFTLGFRVTRLDGVEAGRGRIVIACLDRSTQRSRPLPEPLALLLRSRMP